MAMDIGQTEIATLVTIGKPLVINSQQVKDRRVQVMDMHRSWCPFFLARFWPERISFLVSNVVGKIVRLAVGNAGLDPAPAIQTVKHRG